MGKQDPQQSAEHRQEFMMRLIFRQLGLLIVGAIILAVGLGYRYIVKPMSEDATPSRPPAVEQPEESDTTDGFEEAAQDVETAAEETVGEADKDDKE